MHLHELSFLTQLKTLISSRLDNFKSSSENSVDITDGDYLDSVIKHKNLYKKELEKLECEEYELRSLFSASEISSLIDKLKIERQELNDEVSKLLGESVDKDNPVNNLIKDKLNDLDRLNRKLFYLLDRLANLKSKD